MTLEQTVLFAHWSAALASLPKAKEMLEHEAKLRKEMAASFFPEPVEGVNSLELEQGWVLKMIYKIDRKIDGAALPVVNVQLRAIGVNPDPLVRYKPELDTKAYKTLVQINPVAAKVFDEAMTSKPASPILVLEAPK